MYSLTQTKVNHIHISYIIVLTSIYGLRYHRLIYKPNGTYNLFPIRPKNLSEMIDPHKTVQARNFPECPHVLRLYDSSELRKFTLEALHMLSHATVRKMDVSMRESLLEAVRLMYPHLPVPPSQARIFLRAEGDSER